MNNDALSLTEEQITERFEELTEAVSSDDAEKISACAKEVLILVEQRNKKCKLLK